MTRALIFSFHVMELVIVVKVGGRCFFPLPDNFTACEKADNTPHNTEEAGTRTTYTH